MHLLKDLQPELDKLVEHSVTRQSALLPILHKVQQVHGFLSEDILEEVAEYLHISHADAYEVATFYALFHTEEYGKNIFFICDNISCYLVGAESIIEVLEHETGARVGGNSPDGLFTIQPFSCLGACDRGPSLFLNGELHTDLTADKIKKLVDKCRKDLLSPDYPG